MVACLGWCTGQDRLRAAGKKALHREKKQLPRSPWQTRLHGLDFESTDQAPKQTSALGMLIETEAAGKLRPHALLSLQRLRSKRQELLF